MLQFIFPYVYIAPNLNITCSLICYFFTDASYLSNLPLQISLGLKKDYLFLIILKLH